MTERFSELHGNVGIQFVTMHPGWTGDEAHFLKALPPAFRKASVAMSGLQAALQFLSVATGDSTS